LPVFYRFNHKYQPAGTGRSGPVKNMKPAGPVRSEKSLPVPSMIYQYIVQFDNAIDYQDKSTMFDTFVDLHLVLISNPKKYYKKHEMKYLLN
jgi:hypothetical protein